MVISIENMRHLYADVDTQANAVFRKDIEFLIVTDAAPLPAAAGTVEIVISVAAF